MDSSSTVERGAYNALTMVRPHPVQPIIDNALLKAREEAWISYVDFDCEVVIPRSYKHKGKKSEFLHPWESNEERQEIFAELKMRRQKWYQLQVECAKRNLPQMSKEIVMRWKVISTPDGERHVKTDSSNS